MLDIISYFNLCKFIGKVFLFGLFLTTNGIKASTIKRNRRTDHSPEGFVCVARWDCPINASNSLTLLGTSLNTYSPEKNKNSKTTYMSSRSNNHLLGNKILYTMLATMACLGCISMHVFKVSFKKKMPRGTQRAITVHFSVWPRSWTEINNCCRHVFYCLNIKSMTQYLSTLWKKNDTMHDL